MHSTSSGCLIFSTYIKLRVINEVEDYCLKNGVNVPSARTIRNYVALLKSIGLKFVAKPQLRDLKVHVNRCSFRNACTTYCIAFITRRIVSLHDYEHRPNYCGIWVQRQLFFCSGLKGHSIPHSVKILPMANLAGSVGPMVF